MTAEPFPYPQSMGACADLLYEYRQKRLDAEKVAAALKEKEDALKEYIIDNLDKDSGGAIGKAYKVEVVRGEKPVVDDWPAFFAYVGRTKAWDLLQRRVSEKALADRIADGKKIPGWKPFNTVGVSLTKRLKASK